MNQTMPPVTRHLLKKQLEQRNPEDPLGAAMDLLYEIWQKLPGPTYLPATYSAAKPARDLLVPLMEPTAERVYELLNDKK